MKGTKMIHAMVKMELKPGNRSDAISILHSVAAHVRTKPGCIGCYVYQDTEQENTILLTELWSDEEKMLHHLRSRDYQNVLFVMEMAQNEPEIRFNTVEHITGVETIKMARLGTVQELP